jgi:hypothetical protein
MDELTGPVKEWCQQHGVEISTVSEFLENKDEKLVKAIQDGIDRYNSRAISRAQKVCNHHLLYPHYHLLYHHPPPLFLRSGNQVFLPILQNASHPT